MASSKVIMVMAMLILIFLFGGLMLGFILQSQGVLEKQSGRVVINDEATMVQMATHVALRAYNCDDNGGGHYSAADAIDIVPHVDGYKHWEDWQDYIEYADGSGPRFSFQDLKDATPGNLQCSGTGSSLPLTTDGFLNKLGGAVTASHFGNDQEGRYGRMEFVVNETIVVGGDGDPDANHGCYGLDHSGPDKLTNMYIGVADEDDKNIFEFDNSIGGLDCHAIGNPSQTVNVDSSGGPQKATLLTWTVIGDKNDAASSGDIWNGGELETDAFEICEGATGYVQANTGSDSMAEPTGSEYSLQDTPGGNGEQEGGSILAGNKVRLFMVVEGADDC